MRKYLPLIIVIVIAAIFIGGVIVVRKINAPVSQEGQEAEQAIPDLPEDQKPLVALVPKSDGHWLTLKVSGIKVASAASMDYELLWTANNTGKRTNQGTSSTVQLKGQTSFSKELLLGSESSGKFRYDVGVEGGTLTLRFRDSTGKLLGKVATDWRLQNGVTALGSTDGSFKYTLNKAADTVWFVTMKPFGTPDSSDVVTFSNGWAIYSSDGLPHAGTVGS